MAKKKQQLTLDELLTNTQGLRRVLINSLIDLIEKRITPNEARARSLLARAAMDTVKVEMFAARNSMTDYKPVQLFTDKQIEGTRSD